MALIFEWDASKAAQNIEKHRVSFEQASTIFNDPFYITEEDYLHSEQEE